jgi:hypothetical protein
MYIYWPILLIGVSHIAIRISAGPLLPLHLDAAFHFVAVTY